MKDPFANHAKAIKRCERDIAREWKRAAPELKRRVREGRYEAERFYRAQVYRRMYMLREDIVALRLQMPPFMTKEDGFYRQHPVTEENSHLLRR